MLEWVGCLEPPDLASCSVSEGRGVEAAGACSSTGSWAGRYFSCLFFIFSPPISFGWGIGAAGMCVGSTSLCVCVCVRECTHAQLCGRTSMQEASRGRGLSLPTDSGSDSVPTELALETFLVLTGTGAADRLCSFLSNPKTWMGEGTVGARGKRVSWLHHRLQPPLLPLKIAQDKMLSWSHVLLGNREGRQTAEREQRCPQIRAAVPGSRTTFGRNLAPGALLSHRGDFSPSSIHAPPPCILAALRDPCLHRLTQGHQNLRLPLPERKGVGGEGGTEDPTQGNLGPLHLGSRRRRAEIAH